MTDPGLRFWLRHVEASGGISERSGDSVLLMLPPELSKQHGLAEELLVTDDPDVARSDGVMFMGTGHPVLIEAAESVLNRGDAGVSVLDWSSGSKPAEDVLQDHARTRVPVSHGRIDVTGKPEVALHWVVRVGAMVAYAVSAEDHFSERVERWVHVSPQSEVPAEVVARLTRAAVEENAAESQRVALGDLAKAVAAADEFIETEATRRQAELARQLGCAYDEEHARATTYYADVLTGIERRIQTATPDRRALLEARLVSTREERERRLAEIAEKYESRHEIRPYRLHAIAVPALQVPVDVRRGERRYPMMLDWLLPAGVFVQPACPACHSIAPLVAGKNSLGCLRCLTPKVIPVPVPVLIPAPAKAVKAVKPVSKPPAKPAAKPVPTSAAKPAAKPQRVPAQGRAGVVPQAAPSFKRVNDLVKTFWNAAATGRSLRLKNTLAASSPAAALHTVYGAECVLISLSLPPGEELMGFNSDSQQTAEDAGVTTGVIRTTSQECPYTLRWQERHYVATITEILAVPVCSDGRFHSYYWWHENDPARITRVPPSRHSLDDVAQLLLTEGGPWHGLAIAARALAAWWRLGDAGTALLAEHQPGALAAGVHRLVAFHAGDKGLFQAAADAYRVDESDLRKVDAKLRKLLDLHAGRRW